MKPKRIPVSSRLGLKNSNIIHFNILIIFVVLLVKGVLSTKITVDSSTNTVLVIINFFQNVYNPLLKNICKYNKNE